MKNARVHARERHLWLRRKGGSLGGLDFDQGGHRFLADRVAPPSNPQPTLRAAAQHLTGCTSFAPSYLRKRAAISHLSRQTWQRDLGRAGNREIAGVLERGAGLRK